MSIPSLVHYRKEKRWSAVCGPWDAWPRSFPLIEFTPGRELPALGDALARLGPDDLLFALSQHAVEFAHARLQQQGLPRPLLRAILPLAARRRWPCIRSVGSISITR